MKRMPSPILIRNGFYVILSSYTDLKVSDWMGCFIQVINGKKWILYSWELCNLIIGDSVKETVKPIPSGDAVSNMKL
jgi:hypothetical protein